MKKFLFFALCMSMILCCGFTNSDETDEWEITYQNYYMTTDYSGEPEVYVIVEVENKGNINLYLDDSTFDFENLDGSLAGTCSGMISSDPDIIAPGEKGYFYCNMCSVSGSVDPQKEYVLVPNISIEAAKNDIVRYEISDTSITDGDMLSPVTIIGRIENTTNEDDPMAWVACILYREDDTPIAAFGTNVMDLDAGKKVSFDAEGV